ncbi:MAG: hypothetical protein EON58_23370 [Alphaproteobacteria bacterium]|nr:MAG: hypothetical protein EON58_23370 [Alphaproteobacteria bacterium]
MDRRAQTLVIALLAGMAAKYVYTVLNYLVMGMGLELMPSASAMIFTALVVLLAGGTALAISQRPKRWAVWGYGIAIVYSQAGLYLDTLVRFPGVLQKIDAADVVIAAIQWLVVCAAAFGIAGQFWGTRNAGTTDAKSI